MGFEQDLFRYAGSDYFGFYGALFRAVHRLLVARQGFRKGDDSAIEPTCGMVFKDVVSRVDRNDTCVCLSAFNRAFARLRVILATRVFLGVNYGVIANGACQVIKGGAAR